jgi:hypothetical protein
MLVEILSGKYCEYQGILEHEAGFGEWSSVRIKDVGIIFIDKTYLRKL